MNDKYLLWMLIIGLTLIAISGAGLVVVANHGIIASDLSGPKYGLIPDRAGGN
jgi:hypothetical protein